MHATPITVDTKRLLQSEKQRADEQEFGRIEIEMVMYPCHRFDLVFWLGAAVLIVVIFWTERPDPTTCVLLGIFVLTYGSTPRIHRLYELTLAASTIAGACFVLAVRGGGVLVPSWVFYVATAVLLIRSVFMVTAVRHAMFLDDESEG